MTTSPWLNVARAALGALATAGALWMTSCGPEPLAPNCLDDMGDCEDMGEDTSNNSTIVNNSTVTNNSTVINNSTGNNSTVINNSTINNTSPNTGTPNTGTPNSGGNNGGLPNDGCTLGAIECVDGERYHRCADNGAGGTFWSNPSYCEYAVCSSVTNECCDAPCPQVGAKQCVSGQVQECVLEQGCRVWAAPEPCPGNQICGGNGECVDQCESNCSPNDQRCLIEGGSEYQRCVMVDTDCYQYESGTRQCGGGQVCRNGQCVTECQDDCPQEGQTQCAGSTEQTCQRGGDGCLDWVNTGTCQPQGADCFSNSLGGINVPTGTCVQNATNNTYWTCGDGSTGCLWAYCNDGEWEYQCPRGTGGRCAGNMQNAHATCP